MATLVFDIETVGEQWKALDTTTKDTLTRWVDRTAQSDAERTSRYKDIQEGLGFSPLTGFVVAIAVYDVERAQGAVYCQGNGSDEAEPIGDYLLKYRTEREMLADFWAGASSYDTFVTFNGRQFDVPFLLHRSAIHKIRPTRNLLEGRYPYQQKTVRHVDLLDELTFYGAMRRRPSLHLFCRAYGIDSPKVSGGGDEVATLYANQEFRALATYNAADVTATTELYQVWRDYLATEQSESEQIVTYE